MSKPETITIDEVKYVRADSIKTPPELDGEYSIIRGDRSGVFMGIVEKEDGKIITVKDCRRLWYWDGAASISQIALDGVSKPSSCKFPASVERIKILDVIEIIPCTTKAVQSIKSVQVWSC